jgi:hypothetical protein
MPQKRLFLEYRQEQAFKCKRMFMKIGKFQSMEDILMV